MSAGSTSNTVRPTGSVPTAAKSRARRRLTRTKRPLTSRRATIRVERANNWSKKESTTTSAPGSTRDPRNATDDSSTRNDWILPPRLARATGSDGRGYRTETIETGQKTAASGDPDAIPADNKLAGPGNPRENRRR